MSDLPLPGAGDPPEEARLGDWRDRARRAGAYLLKLEREVQELRQAWAWARDRLEEGETAWKGEHDRLMGQIDRLRARNKRLRAEVRNFKTRDNRMARLQAPP